MIKRILWCFQKFICKNEILWQPACVRLKTPNGLHFDPPWKRHFVHTWCFLFSSLPPSQCMLNALFSFDKTLCLVIITYLWSRFRNLTFCFWFVIIIIIYSSICFLLVIIECHIMLSCNSQFLISVQYARKEKAMK